MEHFHGYVKFNIDVAFHADEESSVAAIILYDEAYQFLVAMCPYTTHVPSTVMVEVMSMMIGLNLAVNLGCSKSKRNLIVRK